MKTIDNIIDDILRVEGGYKDDTRDSGGATCWGCTEAVARAAGYAGAMQLLPKEKARDIYFRQYVSGPNFDDVLSVSAAIAAELVDTGVNMGTGTATQFLQQALNAFNEQGKRYPDLKVDGQLGLGTISALKAFLAHRGPQGEAVMLRALNCLQGARYLQLAEQRPKDEAFIFGWLANRITV